MATIHQRQKSAAKRKAGHVPAKIKKLVSQGWKPYGKVTALSNSELAALAKRTDAAVAAIHAASNSKLKTYIKKLREDTAALDPGRRSLKAQKAASTKAATKKPVAAKKPVATKKTKSRASSHYAAFPMKAAKKKRRR